MMLKHRCEQMLKHQAVAYADAETPLWADAQTPGCSIWWCWNTAVSRCWNTAVAYAETVLKLSLAFKFDWKISETETELDFEEINMVSELSWREAEISADRKLGQ